MTRLFIGALAIGFMAVCMPDRTFAVPQAPQGQTREEVVRDSSPDAAPTKKVERLQEGLLVQPRFDVGLAYVATISTPEVPAVQFKASSVELPAAMPSGKDKQGLVPPLEQIAADARAAPLHVAVRWLARAEVA